MPVHALLTPFPSFSQEYEVSVSPPSQEYDMTPSIDEAIIILSTTFNRAIAIISLERMYVHDVIQVCEYVDYLSS